MWHCTEHLVPWVYHCHITPVFYGHFRQFWVGTLQTWCVILFADVTSLNGAVTSYVMSQHCTCIGHVTFYYKRANKALVGGFLPVVHPFLRFHSYHQRPTCGWCLTCVGRDASSMSPGWSLLPLTVIIVLAFVNSAVSQRGPLSISMRPRSAALLPVSTASTAGLPRLLVGAHVHRVRSNTGKCHMWLLPCAHHFQCMTYMWRKSTQTSYKDVYNLIKSRYASTMSCQYLTLILLYIYMFHYSNTNTYIINISII